MRGKNSSELNTEGDSNSFIYYFDERENDEIRRKHLDMSDFVLPEKSSFPPISENRFMNRMLSIKSK